MTVGEILEQLSLCRENEIGTEAVGTVNVWTIYWHATACTYSPPGRYSTSLDICVYRAVEDNAPQLESSLAENGGKRL